MKIKIRKEKNSLSPSYFPINDLFSIDVKFIKKFLKKKSVNKYISRICLHSKKSDKIHLMIIFQKKGYSHPIKKHPLKTKYYFSILGSQVIKIINKKKKILKNLKLNKGILMCKIPKNTWHSNQTISNNSIHLEVIEGPFNRKKDSIYL